MPLVKEYQSTANTRYLINYHFVWIPKRRKRILVGEIAKRLRQIILDLAIAKDWDILALEVAPDHVHVFISVKPTDTPHLIIKAIKGRSSFMLRSEFPELKRLPSLWTNSYFVNSAGNVSSETIKKYIEDPHHAKH